MKARPKPKPARARRRVTTAYPGPTEAMLNGDPLFDAIWNAIKGWDISRSANELYGAPTGNDARHIYDAVISAAGASNAASFAEWHNDYWRKNGWGPTACEVWDAAIAARKP